MNYGKISDMKITKLGHCCLIIEEGGIKILTDPGEYTDAQNSVRGLTHVIITHEHQDHFHVPSLKQVLANNPGVAVYTNRAVGNLMSREALPYELLQHGDKQKFGDLEVEGIGTEHHVIYPAIPIIMNTGYMFGNKFFYPGDALTKPERPVELLAMPITGPWLPIAEAIDYARALKPKKCFPIHDGNIKAPEGMYRLSARILQPEGINFEVFELGKNYDV